MPDATCKPPAASQPAVFDLDRLYTVEEIAPWLGLSPRTILELARRKKIPCVRFNRRLLRFHPKTILAKG
ncbi:MAG: helix-turn-helix domain-containing protein [Verrucomicrobia bacterium]|nr:helix-turn-helix domain-containing protein [Verrucomicrobiota bacterium]